MIIPSGSKSPTGAECNVPTSSHTWGEIARVCRRICVLWERGDSAAAERVRATDLARAIETLRAESGDSDEAIQKRLDAIMVIEEERVANAAVLAELLAPMLGGSTPASFAAAAIHPPATLAHELPVTGSAPERPRPVNIADFIDEMLAQERAEPHGHRRAS